MAHLLRPSSNAIQKCSCIASRWRPVCVPYHPMHASATRLQDSHQDEAYTRTKEVRGPSVLQVGHSVRWEALKEIVSEVHGDSVGIMEEGRTELWQRDVEEIEAA